MTLPRTPALATDCVIFDPIGRVLLIRRSSLAQSGAMGVKADMTQSAVMSANDPKRTSRYRGVRRSTALPQPSRLDDVLGKPSEEEADHSTPAPSCLAVIYRTHSASPSSPTWEPQIPFYVR
jgi:hypothetical protein